MRDRECKKLTTGKDWSKLKKATGELHELLHKHRPALVFTFGSFAFEFTNRSLHMSDVKAYTYWTTERLGDQFRARIRNFALRHVNVLPLLHTSIARGKFLVSHKYFTRDENGNYFDYVADKVSALLLENKCDLPIWVSQRAPSRESN